MPATTPHPTPDPPVTSAAAVDRSFRWCVAVFALSTLVLATFAAYAVLTRQVGVYLHAVGVIYLLLSVGFLAIVAVVFIQSHFVSSREVEAPKLELFELDQRH